MTTGAKQLLNQVMTLDEEDRVELADMLYRSVGPSTNADYVNAWSNEIAARVADHETGADLGVSWEILRAELMSDEEEDE